MMETGIVNKETLEALEKAVETGLMAQDMKGRFEKTFALARAVKSLQEMLTPEIMADIMPLQGTKLGFDTDNDRDGKKKFYPVAVVKNCLIEALMEGVYPVGNQFNIIAGNMYVAKNGMGQKLKDTPKLHYSITPGVPHQAGEKGAVVEMDVEWDWNGEKGNKKLTVCTRVNSGMGADAIIGKATRKTRAWLFQHLTGREVPEGEADDAAPIDVQSETVTPSKTKTEKVKDKIKGRQMDFLPQPETRKPEIDPDTGEEIPLDFGSK